MRWERLASDSDEWERMKGWEYESPSALCQYLWKFGFIVFSVGEMVYCEYPKGVIRVYRTADPDAQ